MDVAQKPRNPEPLTDFSVPLGTRGRYYLEIKHQKHLHLWQLTGREGKTSLEVGAAGCGWELRMLKELVIPIWCRKQGCRRRPVLQEWLLEQLGARLQGCKVVRA